MVYKLLADAVVIVHFLWILFLITGAFFGVRQRHIKALHIGGLGFAFIMQVFGWYCPLTYLEFWLRSRHDPTLTYRGSFIVYYMEKLIYIELPISAIFALTILLISFNAWYYLRKRNMIK